MPRSRHGVFRLQHAMITIAVMALGLAWAQAEWEPIQSFAGRYSDRPEYAVWYLGDRPLYQMTRVAIKTVLLVATAAACPLMVLLLFLARRGGRRGRFWRARRPGAVACLAGSVVLCFELVHQTRSPMASIHLVHVSTKYVPGSVNPHFESMGWVFGPLDFPHNSWNVIDNPLATALLWMPRHAGFVVAGAWLALVLGRAWRLEPSWIDRAGRIIGVFWIVSALHFFLLPL